MRIFIDADACPVVIREIVTKAADKRKMQAVFVANQAIRLPKSPFVKQLMVPKGFDIADNEIVQRASQGDLVITSDIPLAAEVIAKGAFVLSPRGEEFTRDNVGARLNIRDFMESMRTSGIHTGGPPPLSQSERKLFADRFDRLLTRYGAKDT